MWSLLVLRLRKWFLLPKVPKDFLSLVHVEDVCLVAHYR